MVKLLNKQARSVNQKTCYVYRYRAEVLDVLHENPVKAELYYVDYGDTDVVPCSEVFELRTDFLRLHFQAIECYLAKIGE